MAARRTAAPVEVERAKSNISSAGSSSGSASSGSANKTITMGPNDQRWPSTTNYGTYTNMYKQHPIVRAAVDKLAKSAVASGYQFQPRDSTKPINTAHQQALIDTFARSRMSNVLKTLYVDLLIYGDAYLHIQPSRLGVPYALSRVYPGYVQVVIDRPTREVTSYIVRDFSGIESQFSPLEIIHFRFDDPYNDQYGLSPLESLQSTVAQDLFAQTYNEAFFANSAQTGIVFNMKGASQPEIDRNREFLKKEYTSAANAHKPLLLEGDVEVSKSVSTPAEMQFIDGRKQLMTEILAVYDLPHTKLGGVSDSANRSQAAENDKSFRAESIIPLQAIVEEPLNEVLILQVFKFDDIVFEHNEVDNRDEKTRMDLFLQGMAKGVYSLDFVRGQLGLPPTPGGEEPYIETPLGIMPVSMLKDAAQAILDAKNAPPPIPFGGGAVKPQGGVTPPGGAQGTVPKGSGTPGGPQPKPKAPTPPPPAFGKTPK